MATEMALYGANKSEIRTCKARVAVYGMYRRSECPKVTIQRGSVQAAYGRRR
jgi:hypothetical protein